MRIGIPANPDDLIALAKAILAKNTALGAASPIGGINGFAQFQTQTTTADTTNTQASNLYKQAETANETRDNALGQSGQLRDGTVRYFVTSVRDILLGLNKGSEHKLGDWGFDVTTAAASTPTPKPPQP